jgi:hypothetical protein
MRMADAVRNSIAGVMVRLSGEAWGFGLKSPAFAAGMIMEINPLRNTLQDINERVLALRGYL